MKKSNTKLLKTGKQTQYSTARIGLRARSGGKAQFRTRTTGSPLQVGQAFPVSPYSQKFTRPKLKLGKPLRGRSPLSPLSEMATKEEKALTAAGFKGWTVAVKYKDGEMESIPIVARSYQEAMDKAKPRMNQSAEQVDEIVIVDPSLKEVLHKVGSGAVTAAKRLGRGIKGFAEGVVTGEGRWEKGDVPASKAQAIGRRIGTAARRVAEKIPSAAEKAAVKTARGLGRIAAVPSEIREAYEEAKAERPWREPGPIREYLREEEKVPVSEAAPRPRGPARPAARPTKPGVISALPPEEEDYGAALRTAIDKRRGAPTVKSVSFCIDAG